MIMIIKCTVPTVDAVYVFKVLIRCTWNINEIKRILSLGKGPSVVKAGEINIV